MLKHRAFRSIVIGIVNVLVFCFFIDWTIKNIHPALLIYQLKKLPLLPVASIVILNLLAFVFHGMRLSVLISKPFGMTFRIINLGAAFNTILPFRLGDAARIYYARQIFKVSAAKLLANGLVEKFFDLAALGGLAVAVLLLGTNAFISTGLVLVLFSAILGAYIALQLFQKYSYCLEGWLSGRGRLLPFLRSLRDHGRVNRLTPVLAYTLAIWLANLLVVYFGFSGFLPIESIGAQDVISLLVITALAVAIPSAPAGLGVFEAGVVAYLTQVLHIENEMALAVAICFHLAMTIPQFIFSFYVICRTGFPLNGVNADLV